MVRLTKELPEFETIHATHNSVEELTAVQLMAEIGNIRNHLFYSTIVNFTNTESGINQPGKMNAENNPATKRRSPHLRKTLLQFLIFFRHKRNII